MHTDIDVSAHLGPDTPGIRLIEVSTLSGSATIDGTSDAMGNATDAALFQGLRKWGDVVVVGAGTVKAEDYEGSSPGAARIAVMSYSLDLNVESKLFQVGTPPLILTPDEKVGTAAAQRLESAGATVLSTGDGSIQSVVAALHAQGWTRIVCEGGPGVYSAFIAAGLVDKLYLTLDPHLTSSVAQPLVYARDEETAQAPALSLELENVAADADGTVFLRYAHRGCP